VKNDQNLVRVYYNLHKRKLSVQKKIRNKKGTLSWKIFDYVETISLRDPIFKVYESGRKRVIEESRKNVHAFIIGYPNDSQIWNDGDTQVFYNPYKNSSFVNSEGSVIENANYVSVNGNPSGYSIKIKK
jgi:hypothetical protein